MIDRSARASRAGATALTLSRRRLLLRLLLSRLLLTGDRLVVNADDTRVLLEEIVIDFETELDRLQLLLGGLRKTSLWLLWPSRLLLLLLLRWLPRWKRMRRSVITGDRSAARRRRRRSGRERRNLQRNET